MDMLAAEPGAVEAAHRLVRESPVPCIVTVRTAAEGGGWDGDETDRISFFEAVCTAQHPPRYIDVELSSLERSANVRQKVLLCVDHPGQVRDGLPGLIVSTHDFMERPADLSRRISQMWADPACAVAKVAWRARSLRDVTEAVELLAIRSRPTAAICMGEFGLMTRVLAPKFGSFVTYAHIDGDSATAPGQPGRERDTPAQGAPPAVRARVRRRGR
jgi:3-dehydroquinate dehydratase/shikimate dehydrogenase